MTARDVGPGVRTGPAPWSFTGDTGGTGFVSDLDGGPVHWVRWGEAGRTDTDPLLLVHGLGGSHLNWCLVAPDWARDRSVFAMDLRGFGMTPGFPRPTSVISNRDLVIAFIEQVVGRPVVLVGNSMGGMVSALVAASRPDLVRATVLVDPALPLVVARPDPRVAARFGLFAIPRVAEVSMRRNRTRLSPEALVGQLVSLCFADPTRIDAAVLGELAALARARAADPGQGDIERGFTGAARSLLLVLGRRGRYSRLLAGLEGPVLLIQGDRDRLVHVDAARRVARDNPRWTYVELAGVGHTPQLEVPEETIRVVRGWLADALEPRA
ncbi:alpha/beta fold hydrolase [Knoellia aerolata]|uniref:AB hydrolase-1 domain-containing protein n=1 Tax=Knoellia aerolata DSM 18566 TaxID=1385519 RepID=A0A0A0JXH6_9MICO|nr:alpha/beta fold hydrolase [Knoellia aerolata]KGN42145.1 hypothetical protein N801_02750 [Knoellia aerolata DSM 18566]